MPKAQVRPRLQSCCDGIIQPSPFLSPGFDLLLTSADMVPAPADLSKLPEPQVSLGINEVEELEWPLTMNFSQIQSTYLWPGEHLQLKVRRLAPLFRHSCPLTQPLLSLPQWDFVDATRTPTPFICLKMTDGNISTIFRPSLDLLGSARHIAPSVAHPLLSECGSSSFPMLQVTLVDLGTTSSHSSTMGAGDELHTSAFGVVWGHTSVSLQLYPAAPGSNLQVAMRWFTTSSGNALIDSSSYFIFYFVSLLNLHTAAQWSPPRVLCVAFAS